MHPLLKLFQKDMTRWNSAEWEIYVLFVDLDAYVL